MKQGERKRKLPKDKHEKESWKKRNAARAGKQELHKLTIIAAEEQAAQQAADAAAVLAVLTASAEANAEHIDAFLEDKLFTGSIIDACAGQQEAIDAQAAEQAAITGLLDGTEVAAQAGEDSAAAAVHALGVRTSDYFRAADDPLLATETAEPTTLFEAMYDAANEGEV